MGIWSTIKAEEKKKKEREEKENKERADKKESGKKGSEKTSSQKSYPTAKKAADELGDRFKTTGSPLQRKVVTSKDYKDTKNKPTLADNDRRALLRERETYKIENNKGVSGLLNGLTLGLTDIDRNNTMSVLGGTKEDYDRIKEAKSSTAYKAGDTVGSIVTSLIPYSGAAKAVGASSKVARAGSKVGKLVSKVPGVTEKTAEKVGKGIASSVATDVIAGTPLDVLYSAQQATNYDENGKRFDKGVFGKQLALNTAINIGTGAAMEAAAPAVKRLFNKVPEGQPVLQNNGTTKNVSPKKLGESYANQQRTVDAGVNDTSRMTVDTKVNNVASDTVNTPSAIKDAPEVTARQEADLQTGITPNTETVKATIPPEAPASKNTLGKRTVKSPKLRTQDTITIEDIDFGKSEVMDRFYAKVQDTADYIRNYKPKGAENSLVPSSYGEDFRKLKATISNNDRWYSEFYKQNGRRPNKSEAEELALKLVEDTVKYGNVNEFYDPDFIGFLKQNRVNKQNFSTHDTIISDKTANSIPGKLQQNKDAVKPQTKDLGADVNKYGYQRKTSKVRSNTYENSPMFETVKSSLDEGEFKYDVVTEKESVDRARQRLEVDFDGEVDDLANRKLTFNGEDLDTAMGIAEVYKREAEETGDFSKFIKWAKLIQKKGTDAGQFVQAFAKYTRDTAEGMVVSAQNKVRQAQERINKKNPNLIKRVDEQASGISSDIDNAIADTVSQMTEEIGGGLDSDVIKQALKDSGVEITELIKQDAVKKSEVKDKLIELIETKLREFDIEESLLMDIKEQISDSYDSLLKEKSEQYLRNRFKDKVKSERKKAPLIEDIMGLINMGAYDNDDILDLIRKKNGIPVLDADAVSKITEYMKKSEAATTQRQKDIWRAKAEAIVADFDTSTTAEKIIAFLRINMLGNAKTLVTRNFGGNILLSAAENISEIPAAMVDKAVSLKTGKRTITGPSLDKLTAQAKGFKKGVKEWAEDVKYGVDTSPARDKYDMVPGSTFKGKNPVSKVLKSVENFIFKALQLGDRPFYQAAHDARLAELKKLGITGEEAELQAKLAGLDRTYQNNGKIAKMATKLRRALDSAGFPFGSLLIPFSQTPANIMSKMLDYSPAGLASAIVHLGMNAKNGNFDQRLFSQRVGRSLTGTGILTLGYVLAANDLLVPEIFDSDNYNLYKAEQYSGKVSYSLKVGDYYVGLDSLQPISGVLAVGAEAYAVGVSEQDMVSTVLDSTKAGINTFFNQNFLQSVFDLLSGETPVDGFFNFAFNVPTKAIPSLARQIANATDTYERETYGSNRFKELGNKFIAATPGLRQKMLPEKRDIAGNKVETNQGRGLVMRLAENLVLPDTIKKEVKDAVNDEVMALYKRTDRDGVLLQSAFKSLRADGKDMKLTGKQYTEYQKLMGEKAYKDIADVIKTKDYKELTDDEKVSLIKEINDQAKEAAENQILISAEKARNTVWVDNLNKTYREAYQNVKNTTPKKYAEIVGKAEIDCRLAGDYDMSVKVMSLVSSNADASIYAALDGDKKSGRFYQDMVEPAKLLISKGYTGKQIAVMMNAADVDGNGYLKVEELKSYIGSLDADRETKRALYRMMYNTRSYSKSKGSRLTNNPF